MPNLSLPPASYLGDNSIQYLSVGVFDGLENLNDLYVIGPGKQIVTRTDQVANTKHHGWLIWFGSVSSAPGYSNGYALRKA